jgi:hypothetical protein
VPGGIAKRVELSDGGRDFEDVVNLFGQETDVERKFPDLLFDVVWFAVENF